MSFQSISSWFQPRLSRKAEAVSEQFGLALLIENEYGKHSSLCVSLSENADLSFDFWKIFDRFDIYYEGNDDRESFLKDIDESCDILIKTFTFRPSTESILLLAILCRLLSYRSLILQSNDQSRCNIIDVRFKLLVSIVTQKLKQFLDIGSLKLAASEIQASSTEYLIKCADSFHRELFRVSQSKICLNDLFAESRDMFHFLMHASVVRLIIFRELKSRNKRTDDFWLSLNTVLYPLFHQPVSKETTISKLLITDIEAFTEIMNALRENESELHMKNSPITFSANIRSMVVGLDYTDNSPDIIRYPEIILAFENEIRLINAFSQLCRFEEKYIESVAKSLATLVRPNAVPIVCEFLKPYLEIINSVDRSKQFSLSILFISTFFDHASVQLNHISEIFRNFRLNLSLQFKECHLHSFITTLSNDKALLSSITIDEFVCMDLQEYDSDSCDFEMSTILTFVATYLEIKAEVLVGMLIDSVDSKTQEKPSDFIRLCEIVNSFGLHYRFFEGLDDFDKQLGFYGSILNGLEKAIRVVNNSSVSYVILDFFSLILCCTDFNTITDNVAFSGQRSAMESIKYGDSIKAIGKCMWKFSMNTRFLYSLQAIERHYVANISVAQPPRLYSLICRSFSEAVVSAAIESRPNLYHQMEYLCDFLREEGLFQSGVLSRYFIPTTINLNVGAIILQRYLPIFENEPYRLPLPLASLRDVNDYFHEKKFCRYCHGQKISSFLSSQRIEIVSCLFKFAASIEIASKNIIPMILLASPDERKMESGVRKKDIANLLSMLGSTSLVWRAFGVHTLDSVSDMDLQNAMQLFNDCEVKLEEYEVVDKWLRSKGFRSMQCVSSHDSETMCSPPCDITLREIICRQNMFREEWKLTNGSGQDSKTMSVLLFFIPQRSLLFDSLCSIYLENSVKYSARGALDHSARCELLSKCVKYVMESITKLLVSDDVCLDTLFYPHLKCVIQKLRGRICLISREINLVAFYFRYLVVCGDQTLATMSQYRTAAIMSASESHNIHDRMVSDKFLVSIQQLVIQEDKFHELNDLLLRAYRFLDAVEYEHIIDILPRALHFLRKNKIIDPNDEEFTNLQSLQDLHEYALSQPKIKMRELQHLLKEFKSQLYGMEVHHIYLFSILNEGSDLFSLIRSEPQLLEKTRCVSESHLQPLDNDAPILAKLRDVYFLLLKMLPSLVTFSSLQYETLYQLSRKVIQVCADEETVLSHTSSILACLDRINDLAGWLGIYTESMNLELLQTMLSNIDRYFQSGKVFVRVVSGNVHVDFMLISNGKTISCLNGKLLKKCVDTLKSSLAEIELLKAKRENIEKLPVISNGVSSDTSPELFKESGSDNNLSSDSSPGAISQPDFTIAESFLSIYESAIRCECVLKDATNIGVPAYRCYDKSFRVSSAEKEIFEEIHRIQSAIDDWEEKLHHATRTTCRISMMTNVQITATLSAIESKMSSQIAAQLYICFPDAGRAEDYLDENITILGLPTSSCAVRAAINNIIIAMLAHSEWVEKAPLESLVNLLLAVEEGLAVRSLLCPGVNRRIARGGNLHMGVKLLCLQSPSEDKIFWAVLSDMQTVPMSSQLLRCTFKTKIEDVRRFILATTLLDHVSFAIVDVERLSSECQDYLLYMIERHLKRNIDPVVMPSLDFDSVKRTVSPLLNSKGNEENSVPLVLNSDNSSSSKSSFARGLAKSSSNTHIRIISPQNSLSLVSNSSLCASNPLNDLIASEYRSGLDHEVKAIFISGENISGLPQLSLKNSEVYRENFSIINSPAAKRGQLIILSTNKFENKNDFLHRLSHAADDTVIIGNDLSSQYSCDPEIRPANLNIKFSVLVGGYRSGKQLYLKQHIFQNRIGNIFSLSVGQKNSIFISTFIDWYVNSSKSAIEGNDTNEAAVGIYIRVTSDKSLETLSHFLLNFSAFGLIEDEETGRLERVAPWLSHFFIIDLPVLYDEVSALEGISSTARDHPYISRLPALKVFDTDWILLRSNSLTSGFRNDLREIADNISTTRLNEEIGDKVDQIVSALALNQELLSTMSTVDFMSLNLHLVDTNIFNVIQLVANYLNLRSHKISTIMFNNESSKHLDDFVHLSEVINSFGFNYEFFSEVTDIEKKMGFFLSVIAGVDKAICNSDADNSSISQLILGIFNIILRSVDFNRCIDSKPVHEDLTAMNSSHSKLLRQFSIYIRKSCMTNAFMSSLQGIEKLYAVTTIANRFPLLYEIIFQDLSFSIVQQVLNSGDRLTDKIDVICRFLSQEALFQPGLLSSFFTPNNLNLHIAEVALSECLALMNEDIPISQYSIKVLQSCLQHFEINCFKSHCDDHAALLRLIRPQSQRILQILKNTSVVLSSYL